jgi:hypothetical protein
VKVFISHSSRDKELVAALTDLLTESGLLSNSDLFVSSIDGFDVDDGVDFLDDIRTNLSEATLAITLLTPAYLDSEFCTWELGAIWAMGIAWVPVRVGLKPDGLPLLIRTRQARELGKAALGSIRSEIQKQKDSNVSDERWEAKRDALLALMPQIESALRSEWDSTGPAIARVEARVGRASDKLLEAMERIREAGWIALTLALGREEPSRVFKGALRAVARAIRDLLQETTGCPIRVAIKQLVSTDDDTQGGDQNDIRLMVQDLARDRDTSVRRTLDPVDGNTDFREIVIGNAEYFVSNRLSQLEGYENSHFPDGPPTYEATIVWPVRKIYEDDDDLAGLRLNGTSDFFGFLCVDSTKPDAFSKYDELLVGALAAALYLPLRLWNFEELLSDSEEDDESE